MYQRYRTQQTIDRPVIVFVKSATFDRYRDVMWEKGTSLSQFKMPRVVRRPEMVQLLRENAIFVG